MCINLLDNFRVVGTNYEIFKTEIEKISNTTKSVLVQGGDITFLSLCTLPQFQKEGKVTFFVLNGEYLTGYKNLGERLHICTVPKDKLDDALIEELQKEKEMMVLIGDQIYFLSNMAIPTLTMRSGVSGNSTVNYPSIFRDMHIADATFMRNEKIHFVYREVEEDGKSLRKGFACLGNQYTPVAQTILTDIISMFEKDGVSGNISVHNWEIDHSFTRIFIEFTEMAEDFQKVYGLKDTFIPGLCLQTSDIGNSSITVRGIYRTGRSYVITDEVSHKHTKSIDLENLKEAVDEKIFTNFRKLPEALAALIGKGATPDGLDLKNPKDMEKNRTAVSKIIETTVKKVLGPVLCKANVKSLTEALVAEINPEAYYTMYDIAITLMEVADRLTGIGLNQIENTRKACADIPFVLTKNGSKKAMPEEIEELTLLP